MPPGGIDLGEPGDHPVSPAGNAGRATVTGRRRRGEPLSEEELKAKSRQKKKRRRRKVYAALIAVAIMFLGAGTVVGSWFFQSVDLPEDLRYGEATTFTYSDEKTEVGGYGYQYRKLVDTYDELPREVVYSLLALEDRRFFEHDGVDYKGTLRALVNNAKGGDTQGASTITQQYAGAIADIRDDISYGRKAKEAVMAMKLEQTYSKQEILLNYLNLNFFNRGAYGVAAASEVWFGKDLEELTWSESMTLVMQMKAGDGSFDPRVNESNAPEARWQEGMKALLEEEWITQEEYDEAEFPETLPLKENAGTWGGNTPTGFITNANDGYVFEELERRYNLPKSKLYGEDAGTGGYTIVLTLDKDIQKAAVATGDRGNLKISKNPDGEYLDKEGNVVESKDDAATYRNDKGYFEFENDNEEAALYEYDESMTTAVVAIEPSTGKVLGYFGGRDGTGLDKAGAESPHPPSSTFKMVTAAVAMSHGASYESWWDASSPREFKTLEGIGEGELEGKLRNGNQGLGKRDMTLLDAVRDSKNTPMYAIAEKWGATTVLKTAVDMGMSSVALNIDYEHLNGDTVTGNVNYRFYPDGTYSRHGQLKDEDGEWVLDRWGGIDNNASIDGVDENGDPIRTPLDTSIDNKPAYYHVSFGQYPTSVADMSAVFATIANDGVHVETHYVEKVYDRNGEEVPPVRELHSTQAIDSGVARDLQHIGSTIGGGETAQELGRDYFGKTGTWEASGYDAACRNNPDTTDVSSQCSKYPTGYNAHAWYVGAIPQLSVAAWVGNATSESDPIYNPWGGHDGVYGSNTAHPVWFQLMNKAIEARGYEPQSWAGPVKVGSPLKDDIMQNGEIDPDSAYCRTNAHEPECQVEEEECSTIDAMMQRCELEGSPGGNEGGPGNGNGNGNGNNGGNNGGGNDGGGDDWCWFNCEEEPPTDPEEPGPPGQEDDD
jgi:membrane peptidoglycan carboxypeptidase